MDFQKIIDYAFNVNTWIGVVVLIILLVVALGIILYKKKPEILDIIIDRISGKKANENFNILSENLKRVVSEVQNIKEKVNENQEIVLARINLVDEKIENSEKTAKEFQIKNISDQAKVFEKIKELSENQKVDILISAYSKKIYNHFALFCENRNINKKLKDVFEEGLTSSIDFAKIMLIKNGLQEFDILDLESKLKSNFRMLQASNSYDALGIKDLKSFKLNIAEKIINPLLIPYATKFAVAQSKEKSLLIKEFLAINMDFSIKVIKRTFTLFENWQ